MKKLTFTVLSTLFLSTLFCFSAYAQKQGQFVIRGRVEKSDKVAKRDVALENATVALYKSDKKIAFVKTEKNGEFEFKNLAYGGNYKVIFKAINCIEMFIVLDANIPNKYIEYDLGVQSNFIMYDTKDKEVDAKKFKYPFMKIAFDSKNLAIDKKYTGDFIKGIIPEMKADEEKALEEKNNPAPASTNNQHESELQVKQSREEEELYKKKIKISGKLLAGENPSKPIVNSNVLLVNNKEEVVQTVTTNFMGSFVFNVLPGEYTIKVNESNNQVMPNVKVTFANKDDKEVQKTYADNKGKFALKIVTNNTQTAPSIIVNDSDVKIDLKGKLLSGDDASHKPLIDMKVDLVNKAEIIQSTKTGKDGSFVFKYLGADQNYIIALDEKDPQFSSIKKILLTDENGVIVKDAKQGNDKKNQFELLPYEVNKMSKIYVDDPWLKIIDPTKISNDAMVITELVYFNVNDDKLLPDALKTLDKVILIMNVAPSISVELSSHTDSQGADDYNMKLSERRAKAAVDYIIARGISSNRVSGKGYGETHLLNNCANNIKCSEEEHSKNRRLEFKVLRK